MTDTSRGRAGYRSSLTTRAAAAGKVSRSQLSSDGRALYWLESRPTERGRVALVRARPGEAAVEVSPPDADLRSRVHEYGGGAYSLLRSTTGESGFAFVEAGDQRVWRCDLVDDVPESRLALTEAPPPGERWNHGDLFATADGEWVLAVCEVHADHQLRRSLVAIPTDPGPVRTLVTGRDFLVAPRTDRSMEHLAWVAWDHPHMSWERSELWVGRFDPGGPGPDGRPLGARLVAGGGPVSVGQPEWEADGCLRYVSDEAGWWQPWRYTDGQSPKRLTGTEAEFHGPDWALGQRTTATVAGGAIACRVSLDGVDSVAVLDPGSGSLVALQQPCTLVSSLCPHGSGLAWLGRTAERSSALWWLPALGTEAVGQGPPPAPEPFGPQDRLLLDLDVVSRARPFTFEVSEGAVAHGLLFLPPPPHDGSGSVTVSAEEVAPPPLIVTCHPGPTGSAGAGFEVVTQYFASRGFAVAAVDYRGSTGYGRPFRMALAGEWGIVDTDDCVAAARHLAASGQVDGARMAVRGSSSGGLTALNALIRADCFVAAVAWYGVTDLLALAAATHDFEAHYNDWLIGPLPEAEAEYRRRSPVERADDITGSVLLFQGLDDPVVPPEQSVNLAQALRGRGLRCDLVTFEGESHGFRRASTVEACLEAELAFYLEMLL